MVARKPKIGTSLTACEMWVLKQEASPFPLVESINNRPMSGDVVVIRH